MSPGGWLKTTFAGCKKITPGYPSLKLSIGPIRTVFLRQSRVGFLPKITEHGESTFVLTAKLS